MLYVFKPPMTDADQVLPMVVQIHGGGFISGTATTQITQEIQAYLDSGIIYTSVEYRLLGETHYYSDSTQQQQEEEFIIVSRDGNLSLSRTLKLSDYKVRTGYQELVTKCIYDAARAMGVLA